MSEWLGRAHPLLLVLGTGVALRVLGLERSSFWLDEGYSVRVAGQPLTDLLAGKVGDAHTPPLYYLFLHLWMALGDSDAWIRGLSVLFSVALLALFPVYFRTLGMEREPAAVALGLLAISPFQIYYAQEARMYSLAMLLAVGVLILEARAAERRGWRWDLLLALTGALGIYTHYYLAFVVLGAGGYRFGRWLGDRGRDSIGRILAAHVGMAALLAPWTLVVVRLAGSGGQPFREHLLAVVPYAVLRMFLGYGVLPIDVEFKADPWSAALAAWPWLLVSFAACAMIGAGILRFVRSGRGGEGFWASLAVLASTVVVPLLVSIRVPMFSERYLGVVHPLVVALGVIGCYAWPRRAARVGVAAIAAVMLSASAATLLGSGAKADWRGAAALLAREGDPGETVLLDEGFTRVVLERYLPAGRFVIRPIDAGGFAELPADCPGSGRTWVVLSHTRRRVEDYDRALAGCARRTRVVLFPEEVGIRVVLFEGPPA